jgi:4a-hydroxytetrahydrobiopterin dehydratase
MDGLLSRPAASDAVSELGWRYLLGAFRTSVVVGSMAAAAEVASGAVTACGDDADGHLRVDIRPDRAVLTLQSLDHAGATTRDADLARRISAAVRGLGLRTEPETGSDTGSDTGGQRSVQMLELGIDALDIPAVRPFWKALLGYTDEVGADGPGDALVDPVGQGPAIWFQQMDRPRPQRNRIHLDLCVPHDEAPRRIEDALAAGGRLLSAARAPAFWVLADVEGNEACVTTWQGREG